jgi:CheY-like chemotaxis protein
VHRRPSTNVGASQSESRGYCVKLASSGYTAIKTLEETSVAAVLLEYKQEGIYAEAVACHIKQRFPSLPIILLSAYCEIPERILWLVDDYVMKSEMPLGPHSDKPQRSRQAA